MDAETFKSFCQSLPGATMDVKWDDHLCHCVGEKMFAIQTDQESGVTRVSIKVDPQLFDVLTQQEGIIPAPYLARYKWITYEDIHTAEPEQLRALVKDSYALIFAKLPARVKKSING